MPNAMTVGTQVTNDHLLMKTNLTSSSEVGEETLPPGKADMSTICHTSSIFKKSIYLCTLFYIYRKYSAKMSRHTIPGNLYCILKLVTCQDTHPSPSFFSLRRQNEFHGCQSFSFSQSFSSRFQGSLLSH